MKIIRTFLIISLLMVFGFFAYQTHTQPQTRHNSLAHRFAHPTDTRVRYRIGQIDPRFGLSDEQVRQITHEAVMIWHDGTGDEWFVYDDSAKMSINLIYDERQIETNTRQIIKQNIETLHANHQINADNLHNQRKQLNAQFNALETELTLWHDEYRRTVNRLSQSTNDQERQVLTEKYHQLMNKQHQLNARIKAHQSAQEEFNRSVAGFNEQTEYLNQTINHANARLTPREFHKGEFSHGGHTQINIYEFANIDELRLTLAHELGHALYLGHNDDPTALMYPYAQKQELSNFKLKQADIDLLNHRQFYK